MARLINPYNVVGFYKSRDEAIQQCPIYAPPAGLDWQIHPGSLISSYGASLINADDGTEISITATAPIITEWCDEAKTTYLTYNGGGLAGTPSEGTWYYKLNLDGQEYYSNDVCIENGFASQSWTGDDACSGSAGSFTITVSFSGTTYGTTRIEVDTGTGYTYGGSTSAQIDQDSIPSGGAQVVNWKLTTVQQGVSYWKEYRMVVDTADPCGGTTFTLNGTGGDNLDHYGYIEFYHDTDIEPLDLLYQDGYRQRFYFKRHAAFPTPVEEYTFLTNGQNQQIFESASFFEQVAFDVYPVPDYLLTVLASIRAHDNVSIVSAIDGESVTPTNLTIQPRVTDQDVCSVVRFNYEEHRAFIPGCTEDMTQGVC